MDQFDDDLTFRVSADFSAFRREVDEATRLSAGLGRALGSAFEGAIVRGNDFGDVLRTLGQRLSRLALDAGLRPLERGIGDAISGLAGSIVPFAKGGVVGGPVAFPLAQGTGIAGEAGPEAILPLARGKDGRLGVAASGGGTVIHFNVTTPDAPSFLRSEGQIQAMLSRAAARGRRNL